jgi:hypothetical protein
MIAQQWMITQLLHSAEFTQQCMATLLGTLLATSIQPTLLRAASRRSADSVPPH